MENRQNRHVASGDPFHPVSRDYYPRPYSSRQTSFFITPQANTITGATVALGMNPGVKRRADDSEIDLVPEHETIRRVHGQTSEHQMPATNPSPSANNTWNGAKVTTLVGSCFSSILNAVRPLPIAVYGGLCNVITRAVPVNIYTRVSQVVVNTARRIPNPVHDAVVAIAVEQRMYNNGHVSVKRFKRLSRDVISSKLDTASTLPVDLINSLPNPDTLSWTNNVHGHLGSHNLQATIDFLKALYTDLKQAPLLHYEHLPDPISPRDAILSKSETFKSHFNIPLSILVHNWMIKVSEINSHRNWARDTDLLTNYLKFLTHYIAHFYSGNSVAQFLQLGYKPTDGTKLPSEDTNGHLKSLIARNPYIQNVEVLHFLLQQAHVFTHAEQTFPTNTIGGIIVDFDAMHKEQVVPSYVDWPGKYHNMPGSWPDGLMTDLIFDEITNIDDLKPVRLWDYRHPEKPERISKAETITTPATPVPKKNELVYIDGRPYPARGILKKDNLMKTTWQKAMSKSKHLESSKNMKKLHFSDRISWFKKPGYSPAKPVKPDANRHANASQQEVRHEALQPESTQPESTQPESTQPESTQQESTQPESTQQESTQHEVDEQELVQQEVIKQMPIQQMRFLPEVDEQESIRRFDAALKKLFYADDDSHLEISPLKADGLDVEQQLREEAEYQHERKLEAEKQRAAEEERRKAEQDFLDRHGGLRRPRQGLVPTLSPEWEAKVRGTLHARDDAEIVKSSDGTPLRRHDFSTVVPTGVWLNDEIVNAALPHVANAVNSAAGIKNVRSQTPKVQTFNSFFGKMLIEERAHTAVRTMRVKGIRKETFLNVEKILIPINRNLHWTIVVVQPTRRTVSHIDSMSRSGGAPGLNTKALIWVKSVLQERFDASEWKTETIASPQQTNSDDCGVHAITNGICLGWGLHPTSTYASSEMALQRRRIAAVILNEGFKGDLTLDGI